MNIINKAEEYRQQYKDRGYRLSSKDIKEAFEEGAEWMIDKAYEWVKEHIYIPYEGKMINGEPDATDYIEWTKERLRYAEEVAQDFRKAMEK